MQKGFGIAASTIVCWNVLCRHFLAPFKMERTTLHAEDTMKIQSHAFWIANTIRSQVPKRLLNAIPIHHILLPSEVSFITNLHDVVQVLFTYISNPFLYNGCVKPINLSSVPIKLPKHLTFLFIIPDLSSTFYKRTSLHFARKIITAEGEKNTHPELALVQNGNFSSMCLQ